MTNETLNSKSKILDAAHAELKDLMAVVVRGVVERVSDISANDIRDGTWSTATVQRLVQEVVENIEYIDEEDPPIEDGS